MNCINLGLLNPDNTDQLVDPRRNFDEPDGQGYAGKREDGRPGFLRARDLNDSRWKKMPHQGRGRKPP